MATTHTAWDLIGFDGVCRVKGGKVEWESVDYDDSRFHRPTRVRLARLDTSKGYIRELRRYIHPDTEIEVISGTLPA